MNIKGKRPVRSQVAVGGINRGTRPVRPSRPIPTRQPRRDQPHHHIIGIIIIMTTTIIVRADVRAVALEQLQH